MPLNRYTAIAVLLSLFLCQSTVPVLGQYGIPLNIEKPKEFENRVLQSEKTDKKKFNLPRRFFQNMMTHYNYFFNANNKLNEVLERAKAAHKDDYSQLISFYNYNLDATAAEKTELDSISFKAQTGIVLHDLRSDWADNMYLLWGASYYLQKKFDSAYLMFQFINYAFAEKEKDGYYRTIGSARDGNNAFVVSTKEKSTLTQKIFNEPPSRNDAFIWQVRNYLAQDRFAEAASLIQILKSDPVFPERLHNDLEEVQAYSFYKQKMWDSCASHLVNALSNATNKQEKARWEYLLGQLYETTSKYADAEEYYTKAISHTTDPVMEVYARLSLVRVNKDDSENYIEKNIATLVKMAKRDKYQDYRDIIYYMAAQMELERKNTDGAIALLLKSTQYTSNNLLQRNKAYLQLAELSFAQRKYRQSYQFYDSLQIGDAVLDDPDAIMARKAILQQVVSNLDIIDRQDSLQRIAALPEDERRDYVKKLSRKLRRAQGLKEEGITTGTSIGLQNEPTSLFDDNTSKKGEWYFYNSNSRQKGLTDFKARWGNRPNTDNWRRSTAQVSIVRNQSTPNDPTQKLLQTQKATPETTEITFEGLYEKLPLTEEQTKISNDSISKAMFNLGILYIQQLEDCISGTEILKKLNERFPSHTKMDESLFNIYLCYNISNDGRRGYNLAEIKRLMNEKFPNSNFTTIINTGKNPEATGPKEEATKAYEKVYDLFIEGNFEEALREKRMADNKYGPQYWTPQLLYIESVYHIKQGSDTAAQVVLKDIIDRFSGTVMAEKATTMLDVLSRRAQIEEELRNLVIDMPAPDTTNRQPIVAVTPKAENKAVITPTPKDTVTAKPPIEPSVAVNNKPIQDTIVSKPVEQPVSAYTFETEKPYYVVVVLNKVDPIFVNEAKNAFYRYNRSTYYNKQMNAELTDIDGDNRLLLISPFQNAQEATDYVDRTRPRTASEIIPWLKGGKYYFFIITEKNLGILKSGKDIDKYKQFLEQHIPGKF